MSVRRLSLLILAGAAPVLHGCVAAVVPLAAAGMIARSERGEDDRSAPMATSAPSVTETSTAASVASSQAMTADGETWVVAPMTELPPPGRAAVGAASEVDQGVATAAFGRLAAFVTDKARERETGSPLGSVVLMPDTSLADPSFTRCDGMEPALLVDLDTQFPVAPAPEVLRAAGEAFGVLRAGGVKIIFVSDPSDQGDAVAGALDAASLGPAVRGDTFLMVGDRASSSKDSLRWKIASSHCIIAMTGDSYADFSSLVGSRVLAGDAAISPEVRSLPNAGWFVTPALVDPARIGA